MGKYNFELIKNIPIAEVIEALGGINAKGGRMFHCPNHKFHNNSDKNASMGIKQNTNTCKCFACGLGGDNIDLAKEILGTDFKGALEWLGSTFGISEKSCSVEFIKPQRVNKAIELMTFDYKKPCLNILLKDYISQYEKMEKSQKYRFILTFIYRFSLTTNQAMKNAYYKGRGIDNPTINQIGFIGKKDKPQLIKLLSKYFPKDDLIEFKVFNAKGEFAHYHNVCVVPFFGLYTDIVDGLMFRATHKGANIKEMNLSNSDLALALPFGLNRNLAAKAKEVFICEGHIDALCLKDRYAIGLSGCWGFKENFIGLLKGKKVYLCLDEDEAGRKASDNLYTMLRKHGIFVKIVRWNAEYGKDINDLMLNGKLDEVFVAEKL